MNRLSHLHTAFVREFGRSRFRIEMIGVPVAALLVGVMMVGWMAL